MSVGAVVLAAGLSSRLGFPKQLVRFRGKSLVRRAAEMAIEAACDPVVVVLGARAEQVLPELDGLPVTVVTNAAFAEGMGSSIRAGVGEALRCNVDLEALLITVCDQPRVTAADLRGLIERWRGAGKPIAAARYADVLAVPAVFAKSLFPVLRALTGDFGARRMVKQHAEDVTEVEIPAAAWDVDLPEDVASLDGF